MVVYIIFGNDSVVEKKETLCSLLGNYWLLCYLWLLKVRRIKRLDMEFRRSSISTILSISNIVKS